MATAVKHNLPLDTHKGIEDTVDKFLAGMTWNGCTDFRKECVSNWTKLFATKDVTYTEDAISNFLSLTTCHAALIHTSRLEVQMGVLTN